MTLSAGDRVSVWIYVMRQLSSSGSSLGVTKADLKAAVDAVDDWCDTNATSYNTAIPQPARGVMNAAQKALLLAYVCLRRAGDLHIPEDE